MSTDRNQSGCKASAREVDELKIDKKRIPPFAKETAVLTRRYLPE